MDDWWFYDLTKVVKTIKIKPKGEGPLIKAPFRGTVIFIIFVSEIMIFARTIIIVLVFLMSTGIYVYERHLANQGQIGPVSQLIDFVRFGKYAQDRERTSRITGEEDTVNIQEYLLRLQETYDALYKERGALIKKRQEILAELSSLNNQLLREAGTYAEALSQEQAQFLEEFPELKEMAVQMAKAYMTEDPAERTQQLLKAEESMGKLFKAEGGGADGEAQRLKNHLRNILTTIQDRYPEQFQSFCENPDPAECLNADPQQAQELAQKILHAGGEELAADVNELKGVIKSLSQEYYMAAENYTASEQFLEQHNQRIEGDLKQLSTQLVEVTDLGVEEINILYKDLLFEYDVVLENLALNLRRLDEKQKMLEWQMNHAKGLSLGADGQTDMAPLEAIKKKQSELLSRLEENLLASDDTYQRQRDLGNSLARIVRENRQGLPGRARGIRVEHNNRQAHAPSARSSSMSSARPSSTPPTRPSSTAAGIQQRNYTVQDTRAMLDSAAARNSDIANQAKEQMRRLRDKARDQGFYDRTFPSSLR